MKLRTTTLLIALAACAGRADAAFVIEFNQVGNAVVATGSGSLTNAGILSNGDSFTLASVVAGGTTPFIDPSRGFAVLGQTGPSTAIYLLGFFAGPANFGMGSLRAPTSGTGDRVGISLVPQLNDQLGVAVPSGYRFGSSLTSSSTYANATIAGLGLTPGSYVFTYSRNSDGPVVDSLTIRVNAAPGAVPEPASLAMLGLGLAGVGGVARMRRRS